jgi:hypothetical protein
MHIVHSDRGDEVNLSIALKDRRTAPIKMISILFKLYFEHAAKKLDDLHGSQVPTIFLSSPGIRYVYRYLVPQLQCPPIDARC